MNKLGNVFGWSKVLVNQLYFESNFASSSMIDLRTMLRIKITFDFMEMLSKMFAVSKLK